MGILAVDSIKSRTVAPVTVSDDLNVTGVSTVGVLTATSVVVGSAVTVNADGVITSGIVTATTFQGNFNGTTGTFSGDVSIGGTLTYEDVERVDATGLSTFREGLNVGSPTGVGGTFNPQGDISAGIGSFSGAISGGALSGTTGTFTGALSGTTGTFTGDVSIADKIIHTGDTDTAIRFSGTDTITAETAGSERLRITSGGDVLIGRTSTSTSHTLCVQSDNIAEAIGVIGRSSDDISEIGFFENDTTTRLGEIQYRQTYMNLRHRVGDIVFCTGGSNEKFRITSTGGVSLTNGELVERCYIQSGNAWSSVSVIDLDNGMVQYNNTNLGGTGTTLDIKSSAGINTTMSTGDIMSVTCITAVNASTAYVNNITIDGIAATESWVGGSAPSDGGSSGVDTYAFNIIKTADATFVVIANQVKTS